jgi:hypothetical protein
MIRLPVRMPLSFLFALSFSLALSFLLTCAAAVPRAAAQDGPDGFRSPTGNISCMFFDDEDEAVIRCDLAEMSNRAPPRPSDCDMEWRDAFEIAGKAEAATRICHGDTTRDERLPVLPYGSTFARKGLTCKSERSGVTCANARGHGFEIARARQRMF